MAVTNKKSNDWVVSLLNNPDLDYTEFGSMGLNKDNTQLLSYEDYKNTPLVQKTFVNEDNKFDENKFKSFYDYAQASYSDYSEAKYLENFMDNLEYDASNTLRKMGTKTRDNNFKVMKVNNPLKQGWGLTGPGSIKQSDLSVRELAQQNVVRDNSTGESLGYTPNDWSSRFWNFFTKPTVVLAQWEEDGETSDEEGNVYKHFKGQPKIDSTGNFYYETLGDRDISGKQVLSFFDTITTDGSSVNKFDFFDSDDAKSNYAKTLTRSLVKLAPMLIPGNVGKIYTALTAAAEMPEVLSYLWKSSEGIVSNNNNFDDYSSVWKTFNNIEARSKQFSYSTTDEGASKILNWENMFRMLGDVGLQLSQQRMIASIPNKFQNIKRLSLEQRLAATINTYDIGLNSGMRQLDALENLAGSLKKQIDNLPLKYNTLSKNLSLGYMALTSSNDAYQGAKESGYDERMSGIIALATTAGLYGVMNYNGGTWAIDDIINNPTVKNDISNITRKTIQEWGEVFTQANSQSQATKMQVFNELRSKVFKYLKHTINHPDNLIKKGLVEGYEEVTEELTQDAINALSIGAQELGFINTQSDYSFMDTNPLERYAMSFLGGVMGGSVFGATEMWKKGHQALGQDSESIIQAVYNYGADTLIKSIESDYTSNNLPVSKTFSATEYVIKNGNKVFAVAQDETDSQAYSLKELLKNQVRAYDNAIRQGGFAKDIDLMRGAFSPDERLANLIELDKISTIKDDWRNLMTKYININSQIRDDNGTPAPTQDQQTQLNEIRREREEILSGERFTKYLSEGLFLLSQPINNSFVATTLEAYVAKYKNKEYNSLTPDEQDSLKEEYRIYRTNTLPGLIKDSVNILSEISRKLTPYFEEYKEYIPIRKDFVQNFNNSFTEDRLNPKFTESFRNSQEYGLSNIPSTVISDSDLVESLSSNPEYKVLLDQFENDSDKIDAFLQETSQSVGREINRDELSSRIFHKLESIKRANYLNDTLNTVLQNNNYLDEDLKDIISKTLNSIKTINSEYINTDLDNILYNYDENLDIDDFTDLKIGDTALFNKLPQWLRDIDISDFDNYKSKIINEIENSNLNNQDKKKVLDIMDIIFNRVFRENQDLYNISLELSNKLNSIKNNPIYDYLRRINITLGGNTKNVFDILEENSKILSNISNINEFVISNQISQKELDEAINQVKFAQSVLQAAKANITGSMKDGYNAIINNFDRNANLPTLDPDLSDLMIGDLGLILNKLDFINELSKYSKSDKLIEQKNIGVVTRTLFGQLFLSDKYGFLQNIGIDNNNESAYLLDNLNQVIVDFKYINNVNTKISNNLISEISKEEMDGVENELRIIENLIYDNTQKILKILRKQSSSDNISAEEKFAQMLFNQNDFPKEIMSQERSMNFTSSNRSLGAYDIFTYLATITSFKSQDFLSVLKDTINDNFNYAPIFTQEYVARQAASWITNKPLMNAFVKTVNIDSNNLKLYNTGIIFGATGAGKTSSSGRLITKVSQILSPDNEIWISAPNKIQADNLAKSTRVNSNIYDRNQLMSKIFRSDVYQEIQNEMNAPTNSTNKYITIDKNIERPILKISPDQILDLINPGNDNKAMILFDEVTHLSIVDLQLLSMFAEKTNKILIGFGDSLQSGYEWNNKESNINWMFSIKSPVLSYSIRNSNNLKKENNEEVRTLSRRLENNQYASAYMQSVINIDQEYKNDLNNLELKYLFDERGLFGEKIINNLTFEEIQRLLDVSESKKIGIISDNYETSDLKNIVDKLGKEYFDIYTPNTVQGMEGEYFIMDVDLRLSNSERHSKLLNTLLGRSEKGTLIYDHGNKGDSWLKTYGVKNIESVSVHELMLTDDIKEQYKIDRVEQLNNILGTYQHNVTPQPITTISNSVNPELDDSKEIMKEASLVISDGTKNDSNFKSSDRMYKEVSILSSTMHDRWGVKVERNQNTGKISKIYRTQNDNSDMNIFNWGDELSGQPIMDYRQAIWDLKMLLIYSSNKDDIINGFDKVSVDIRKIAPDYDWINGKFKLVATKYNNDIDKSNEVNNLDYEQSTDPTKRQNGSIYYRLVYEAPIINEDLAEYDYLKTAEITISSMFTEGTIYSANNPDLNKKFQQLDNLAKTSITNNNPRVQWYLKDNWDPKSMIASHVRLLNKFENNKPVSYSLRDIKTYFPFLQISNPNIITTRGDISSLTKDLNTGWDSESVKMSTFKENWPELFGSDGKSDKSGSSVGFITANPILRDPNTNDYVINHNSNTLYDYYRNQRISGIDNTDSGYIDGMTRMIMISSSGRDFYSFLNEYQESFKNWSKSSGTSRPKYIDSIGHKYLGANIVNALYKARYKLSQINNLDSYGSWKTHYDYLNTILNHFEKYYNDKDPDFKIEATNDSYNLQAATLLNEIIKSPINGVSSDSRIKEGFKNLDIPLDSDTNVFKGMRYNEEFGVVSFLYRMTHFNGYSKDGYETGNNNAIKAINFALLGTDKPNVFLSEEQLESSWGKNREMWPPFYKGIFYNPVFASQDTFAKEDYIQEAYFDQNGKDQFQLNTAFESPRLWIDPSNFILSEDLDKENDIKSGVILDIKSFKFSNPIINNIFNEISTNLINMVDNQNLDENVDNFIFNIDSEITTLLNSKILDRINKFGFIESNNPNNPYINYDNSNINDWKNIESFLIDLNSEIRNKLTQQNITGTINQVYFDKSNKTANFLLSLENNQESDKILSYNFNIITGELNQNINMAKNLTENEFESSIPIWNEEFTFYYSKLPKVLNESGEDLMIKWFESKISGSDISESDANILWDKTLELLDDPNYQKIDDLVNSIIRERNKTPKC